MNMSVTFCAGPEPLSSRITFIALVMLVILALVGVAGSWPVRVELSAAAELLEPSSWPVNHIGRRVPVSLLYRNV